MQSFLSPAIFLVLLLVSSLSTPPRSLWIPRESSSGDAGIRSTSSADSASTQQAEEVVWILLRNGDDLNINTINNDHSSNCLGPYGFTTCGDLSFWLLSPHISTVTPSSLPSALPLYEYQLRHTADLFATDLDYASSRPISDMPASAQCLTQKRHFSLQAAPFLSPCPTNRQPLSSSLWRLSPAGQLFYNYRGVTRCLARGLKGEARTEKCSPSSPSFDIITHMSAVNPAHLWTNPETGATFPRDIADKVGCSHNRKSSYDSSPCNKAPHVLFGGGTYAKHMLGLQLQVYTVGWYVDLAGASTDFALKHLRTLPAAILQEHEAYFEALAAADRPYDRSLLVTFLVDVKTKTLLDGVVEDSDLSSSSLEIISKVYKQIDTVEFTKGMEIIFTWRSSGSLIEDGPSSTSEGSQSVNIKADALDILILAAGGGVLQSLSLTHPGLARELFLQFVHPSDPLSPAAKASFAANFHAALSADSLASSQ
mmetsp:Transcript_8539/g.14482  ORF Transcript_8539/g.14482 Transcript_8539/m.14482 type:complete len:482 (-) Transcript_8539:140-1585(-)